MKKKKGGAKAFIIVSFLLLLLTGCVIYFGFINNKTAVPIREFIAAKLIEQGKYSKAETVYYDILTRDETNTDAYLALADIYIRDKDYKEAHEILAEGLECSPCEAIADMKWGVYEKEARLVEEEGSDKEILAFVNEIPADDLLKYYDDVSGAEKYAKEDAQRWLNATLSIAESFSKHGDYAGAQTVLEDAKNDPLNEYVDLDAIDRALIPVLLEQGKQALAAGDPQKNARYFFNRVLELDPENKDALDGLAKLDESEKKDPWKKIDINAVVRLDLDVNMHGIKLSLPVVVNATALYDGRRSGAETIDIEELTTVTVLGQKQEQSETLKIYQEGKDIVMESKLTGKQREKNVFLNETLFNFISDYHALISSAPYESGTQQINGVECKVSRASMRGKDYLYFTPKNTIPDGVDTFMKTLTMDVVRYTAADDGRVVRVEAAMTDADEDALNDLITQFVGKINADVSVKSMTVTVDVDCK